MALLIGSVLAMRGFRAVNVQGESSGAGYIAMSVVGGIMTIMGVIAVTVTMSEFFAALADPAGALINHVIRLGGR